MKNKYLGFLFNPQHPETKLFFFSVMFFTIINFFMNWGIATIATVILVFGIELYKVNQNEKSWSWKSIIFAIVPILLFVLQIWLNKG